MSTANYLELTDTSDSQNHSRYVQFDLGDEYDLMKIPYDKILGWFQENTDRQ